MLIYRSRGNSSIGKDILTLEKGFICTIQFVKLSNYEKKINVQINGF